MPSRCSGHQFFASSTPGWAALIFCQSFLFFDYNVTDTCTIYVFRGQKRKTHHRHIRTRSWPLGAVYAWLLDVSLTNAAIIYKDADNPSFVNCNAKPLMVAELLELLNSAYSIPRVVPHVVGRHWPANLQLTDQQMTEIAICTN